MIATMHIDTAASDGPQYMKMNPNAFAMTDKTIRP